MQVRARNKRYINTYIVMDTTKTSIHEFFDSLTENAGANTLVFGGANEEEKVRRGYITNGGNCTNDSRNCLNSRNRQTCKNGYRMCYESKNGLNCKMDI